MFANTCTILSATKLMNLVCSSNINNNWRFALRRLQTVSIVVVPPPPLKSELCPLPQCGEVYRLDFSHAQTNGSSGAALALYQLTIHSAVPTYILERVSEQRLSEYCLIKVSFTNRLHLITSITFNHDDGGN